MEKNSVTLSMEGQDDLRQYACLRKFEKIVNQFDEMMEMVDAVTKPPKRRRISNSRRNKSTSMADAGNSASTICQETLNSTSSISAAPTPKDITTSNAEEGETESSKFALLSKAEKFAALEQIMTRHLNDLQTDCGLEFPNNLDN